MASDTQPPAEPDVADDLIPEGVDLPIGDTPLEQVPELEGVELPVDAPPIGDTLELAGIDDREKALPIRPGDLTRLLLAQPGLNGEEYKLLACFGPRLGSYFHNEFYGRLRDLKESYAPLDPDSDYAHLDHFSREATDTLDEEFLTLFEATLERANYRPLDNEIIHEAVEAPNEMGLNYVPDFTLFEHLRVYARGFTKILRVSRNARTKFRKRTIVLDAYQRLVVVLKFKDGLNLKRLGPHARSDALYLRMFKDVPHVDMEMHLPEQGTKVKMRWLDKAQIASPLMVGIPTVALKLLLAAAISPMMLGTALVAPFSAGVNSFFGFQRAKQKHLSSMIRSLYYLTLANNGSVLTRLIDSAEEEEYKETLLSYFFLLVHHDPAHPLNSELLDSKIEAFLKETTGCEINFEIDDALSKLYRLGLARLDTNDHLIVTPLEQALAHLEDLWNGAHRSV
jgi:hypothetical protein